MRLRRECALAVQFIDWNLPGMHEAKQNGVPLVMTEYNSASCGGDATVGPSVCPSVLSLDVL